MYLPLSSEKISLILDNFLKCHCNNVDEHVITHVLSLLRLNFEIVVRLIYTLTICSMLSEWVSVEYLDVSDTGQSGTVNSKSFLGKVLLRIRWKFELNYTL